ncbi:hypothetical protein B0H11DRAFT_2065549 [Mycena galericulata]|nr:hypothetical protein B0H11DRAFT_2065549 [Mycena galericulata]
MDAGRLSDIHRRIEKLSSEIARQREILRDLENQKSAAQGELNTVLDPMSRLPLEISSDIMLRCLPTMPRADPLAAPMVFLNICRSWRNMALATPALWAAIRLKSPLRDEFMHRWPERAGTIWPLSLSVVGPVTLNLCALFDRCMHQIQSLEFYFPHPSGPDLEEIPYSRSFTSLKTLTVGHGNSIEGGDEYSLPDHFYPLTSLTCDPRMYVEMLHAAPNLVECRLDNICFLDLAVSSLVRSSSPLQSFGMVLLDDHLHGPHVQSVVGRLFPLIPSVTDLDLSLTGRGADLIALMAALHSGLLPALRNLTYTLRSVRLSPLALALVHALLLWRTRAGGWPLYSEDSSSCPTACGRRDGGTYWNGNNESSLI